MDAVQKDRKVVGASDEASEVRTCRCTGFIAVVTPEGSGKKTKKERGISALYDIE